MADRSGAIAALAAAALLAACHATNPGNQAMPAPEPSATTPPSPTPAATPAAALGRYVGHYPFDKLDGTRFLDQPAVIAAVGQIVPDAKIRVLVLGGDGPTSPIALQAGRLVAWGCETHNCGDHNWSTVIAPDGGDPAVCYHDAAMMKERARWYLAPDRTEMREGDCPSG